MTKRFFVTTIDSEYNTLKKATINVKSYMRRGRMVNAYTQQRLVRKDVPPLIERAKAGGFSWRAWGQEEPKTGFMVGIKKVSGNLDTLWPFFKEQAGFVKENSDRYYGAWIDNVTGKVYLDVSLNVQNQSEAEKLGKKRKEISIWDVEKREEIRL